MLYTLTFLKCSSGFPSVSFGRNKSKVTVESKGSTTVDILNSAMPARYQHFLVHCTRRNKQFLMASHLPILTAISLAVFYIQSYNRSRGAYTTDFTPFMGMTKIASKLPSIKASTIHEYSDILDKFQEEIRQRVACSRE